MTVSEKRAYLYPMLCFSGSWTTSFREDDTLGVVKEGGQSRTTISEMCQRYQVSDARFYRWERLARQGVMEALPAERNGKLREAAARRKEVNYMI